MNVYRASAVFLLGTSVHIFAGIGYAQGTEATTDTAVPDNSAKDPTQDQASEGVKGYLMKTFQVTGSARVRVEAPSGSNFTVSPADAYALTRVRLGLGFTPVSWFHFFAEAEDSRAEFYKVTPPSTVSDPFELRQLYVEAGTLEGNGAKMRLGRQELFIGSRRLISTGDWSNITKNFDVARGTLTERLVDVDLIAGQTLLDDPNRMDRDKAGEHFYAAYSAWKKIIPGGSVEPYLMAKTARNVKGKDNKLGDADTLYGGLRLIGKVPGGFDYNAEAIREFGGYADDVVQAFGYVGGGGWTLTQASWKPHFNGDFAWATGDSGRKDGHHESFDYMYGDNQPLNSLTGMIAWRNIGDLRAGVDFNPLQMLKVKIDFRDYWLATVQDGLYNCSGTRLFLDAKATSTHVGEGVDAQFLMTLSKKMTLGLGIGTITPGAYLRDAGKHSGYIYPYMSFTRAL